MIMVEYLVSAFQLYKFLIELVVFSAVFVIPLPHRKDFLARLLLSGAVCMLLSSYWNRALAQIMLLAIGRYLLLFFAVAMSIWFCFRCSWKIALFCGMGGYASQHLFFKLTKIATAMLPVSTVFTELLLYFLIFALVFVGVSSFFGQHIRKSNYQYMANSQNLILCGFVLLCAIVLSAYCTAYGDTAGEVMLVVCYLYDCVCCVMALWIQRGLFQLDHMKQEMLVVRQLWYQEKKQLESSKENIDLINIKCHDMKHLIAKIRAQGGHATDSELQNIQELINIYDFSVNTGNDILNLLLAEKGSRCQKARIRLNCIADGEKLSFMEEADIYSLFGNALDNAISAVQELEDEQKRVITLTVKEALGMLSICIENYYIGELDFENSLPITKADQDYHGYGVKSMCYLAEKYRGELNIQAEDGVFKVNMLFPL